MARVFSDGRLMATVVDMSDDGSMAVLHSEFHGRPFPRSTVRRDAETGGWAFTGTLEHARPAMAAWLDEQMSAPAARCGRCGLLLRRPGDSDRWMHVDPQGLGLLDWMWFEHEVDPIPRSGA